MKTSAWFPIVFACLAILAGHATRLTPLQALAQQPGDDDQESIVVHLASGRAMTAKLDARTDTAQLWLRWESPRAELLRPIQWDRVVTAEIKGQEISGKQLFELVAQIRQEIPTQPVITPLDKTIVMPGSPAAEALTATASYPSSEKKKTPPVRSLAIDAKPANWDNNVETDGMMICIAPRDDYGEVIPVRGTLDIELMAEHAGVVKLPYPFSRIAHWSQMVRPEDFRPFGAVYRLPFQDVSPEFSRNLSPHGAIHATLSVPGQGTFEATDDARLRPYSLIRDRLQQTTGQRFFPEETIGRPW